MPFLIDSDWVIDHLEELARATELLERLIPDGIAISIITYIEVFQGIERSPNPDEARRRLTAFLAGVPVLPFSTAVAERCARLRETLRQQGKRVNSRALDLLNAATALEYGLILVTRNLHDYDDLPNCGFIEKPEPPGMLLSTSQERSRLRSCPAAGQRSPCRRRPHRCTSPPASRVSSMSSRRIVATSGTVVHESRFSSGSSGDVPPQRRAPLLTLGLARRCYHKVGKPGAGPGSGTLALPEREGRARSFGGLAFPFVEPAGAPLTERGAL